jgi:hypothetical protein
MAGVGPAVGEQDFTLHPETTAVTVVSYGLWEAKGP